MSISIVCLQVQTGTGFVEPHSFPTQIALIINEPSGLVAGDLEQMNSFPTIAVWSAVKFVIQENNNKYAFLPLITDPDNIDKQSLFTALDDAEKKYINSDSHSPLFAVVMRKIGVHKQLECHG